MARRANATPALALLSFRPIHRLKGPTELKGAFITASIERALKRSPPTHRRISHGQRAKEVSRPVPHPVAVMGGWAETDRRKRKPPKTS